MRFEARELKAYAEPVPVGEFKEGAVYFLLEFLDIDMHVPRMEPVIFLGRNLEDGDVSQLYFQDAVSYRKGIRYGDEAGEASEEAVFIQTPETRGRPLYEYESALDILLSCSLRRREARGTT